MIVDAFTDKPFPGNPAAVCTMGGWPSEEGSILGYHEEGQSGFAGHELWGRLVRRMKYEKQS